MCAPGQKEEETSDIAANFDIGSRKLKGGEPILLRRFPNVTALEVLFIFIPLQVPYSIKLSMREKRIQENNLLRRLPHHNLAALRVEPPLTFKKVFLYSCKGSNYIYF